MLASLADHRVIFARSTNDGEERRETFATSRSSSRVPPWFTPITADPEIELDDEPTCANLARSVDRFCPSIGRIPTGVFARFQTFDPFLGSRKLGKFWYFYSNASQIDRIGEFVNNLEENCSKRRTVELYRSVISIFRSDLDSNSIRTSARAIDLHARARGVYLQFSFAKVRWKRRYRNRTADSRKEIADRREKRNGNRSKTRWLTQSTGRLVEAARGHVPRVEGGSIANGWNRPSVCGGTKIDRGRWIIARGSHGQGVSLVFGKPSFSLPRQAENRSFVGLQRDWIRRWLRVKLPGAKILIYTGSVLLSVFVEFPLKLEYYHVDLSSPRFYYARRRSQEDSKKKSVEIEVKIV